MYKRFKWNPEIRLDLPTIYSVDLAEPNSKIFVGSTIELFGDWVKPEWWDYIWGMVKARPEYTFIFLTKQPQNLPNKFPDNCWVGVTATDSLALSKAIYWLSKVEAKVKYISVEPLLNGYPLDGLSTALFKTGGINWIIIGSQTKPYKPPKIEWVKEIVEAADKVGIPVFLKDNLKPLFAHMPYDKPIDRLVSSVIFDGKLGWNAAKLRQEVPVG